MRRLGGLTHSGSVFVVGALTELPARATKPAAQGVAAPARGVGQAARGPAREQRIEGGDFLLGEL
jgi:hypothetical protein